VLQELQNPKTLLDTSKLFSIALAMLTRFVANSGTYATFLNVTSILVPLPYLTVAFSVPTVVDFNPVSFQIFTIVFSLCRSSSPSMVFFT
jgi:hypothetical protein